MNAPQMLGHTLWYGRCRRCEQVSVGCGPPTPIQLEEESVRAVPHDLSYFKTNIKKHSRRGGLITFENLTQERARAD
ncbi:hypothetical protein DPEC_G00322820 [Dallia pectoralis]|uniref:Uncharacterized protein n=1 Tax=Dallia pectoralis TaxID=75939 RepID=A0ACC2FAR1_DALPE|nr:hypothetical protein DPEC_G00322820 [Dallia pectoralis]